jgi:hypothetical protein
VLKLAGKTAVVGTGLAAGAALLGAQPAAANHLAGFGHDNDEGATPTNLYANTNSNYAFKVRNNGNAAAIYGSSSAQGVSGFSQGFRGVQGGSDTGAGVYGFSYRSNAVVGEITDTFANAFNAVFGTTSSNGNAVFGQVTNTSGDGNAVLGIHNGPGNCVFGFKPGGVSGDAVVGFADSGRGVFGISRTGRGLVGQGGTAPLRLVPSGAATHPGAGLAGDLFVDNAARLWFCKGGSNWRQVA